MLLAWTTPATVCGVLFWLPLLLTLALAIDTFLDAVAAEMVILSGELGRKNSLVAVARRRCGGMLLSGAGGVEAGA